MIKHCGNLFGGYFGGDTSRSYRPQTHRQVSHRQNHADGDPFLLASHPIYAQPQQEGPKRMVSLIAGMREQQCWGSENQSMGPGSLNSIDQAQQAQQQKAARKLGSSKPPPIDIDIVSNHSSESAGSRSAGARGRPGSLPASPSRRLSTNSDRGSKEAPWLQGRQFGQVEKALQKNKIRSGSHHMSLLSLSHPHTSKLCCNKANLRVHKCMSASHAWSVFCGVTRTNSTCDIARAGWIC